MTENIEAELYDLVSNTYGRIGDASDATSRFCRKRQKYYHDKAIKASKENGSTHYDYHHNSRPTTSTQSHQEVVSSPIKIIPTVLVLFIKADSANMLIDAIKQKGALYIGAEKDLFVNAMKMWVGTDTQFAKSSVKADFRRNTSVDSFVKEYDYVAMRFQLDKEYSGCNSDADSYERNQFFENICKDNVRLVECSERLSFNDNTTTEVYDVYGR